MDTCSTFARGVVACLIFALASGCRGPNNVAYQGWVEEDPIFVSPDELGRIVVLKVREGDHVNAGALLCSLDDDLQRAALRPG